MLLTGIGLFYAFFLKITSYKDKKGNQTIRPEHVNRKAGKETVER
jgi:hypothetical protein